MKNYCNDDQLSDQLSSASACEEINTNISVFYFEFFFNIMVLFCFLCFL